MAEAQSENALPPLVPPNTKTPGVFNQQVNINQIPTHVLDKLSAEQIANLTSSIMTQAEKMDERRFTFARESQASSAKNDMIAIVIGGVVALGGFVAVAYLAATGNGIVAGTLASFIATIIAVVVGKKISS